MQTNYKNLNKLIDFISVLSMPVFSSSLISYLLFLLLDSYRPGFVSYYINLNHILWLVLSSGIALILLQNDNADASLKTFESKWLGYLIAIVGGLIIYFKTKELGYISLLLGIISFFIIMISSKLIYNDKKKTDS